MMNMQSFLGLFQNISLLLAAALIFDVIAVRGHVKKQVTAQIASGLALGAIGMAVMLTPWTLAPGVIFDTRSVLIGVSGLFFGSLPTLIAMAMTSALRIYQGGLGMLTGVCVIVASGLIGIAWRRFRKAPLDQIGLAELYLFGIAVHVAMLLLMLTFPWETAQRVLANISLPVLLIYPPGTALMGSLLVNRLRREHSVEALKWSEEKYRALFEAVLDPLLVADRGDGRIVDCNAAAEGYFGLTRTQLLSLHHFDLHPAESGGEYDSAAFPLVSPGLMENVSCVCAGGEIRRAEVRTSPFHMHDSELLVGVFRDVTERELAEEALRDSEARYRTYVDSAPSGIFIMDSAGMYMDVNPEACRMSGYAREELLAMGIGDFVAPESREAGEEHFRRLRVKGLAAVELLCVRKDGEKRWCSVSATRMSPDRFLGFVSDVTERRQREEARFIFMELLENAEDIVVFKDKDLRYVTVNRAYTALTGNGPEDVVGRTDSEVFAGLSTPEQIAAYIENDRTALALPRGQCLTIEEGMLASDGSVRTFLTKKFPIYSEDERLLGTGTMVTEITARKRVEDALRLSEERLSLAMAATNDALWDWDVSTGKAYFSPRYYTMLDYEPGEFGGSYESWKALLHPDDLEPTEQRIAQHLRQLSPFDIEFRLRTKSGQWLWVLARGRVVEVDEQGRARRMVGTHLDLTERKQFEQELTLAKEAAEVANHAKSEFLANMSHEIRTPLNGILGMLQLMQLTPLDEEQTGYSDLAIQSTLRLTRLLSDILDISRVEAGKMQILSEPFDLRDALMHSIDLLRPLAMHAGVEFLHHIDPSIPQRVAGDAARVQQVLINLIGNALKFTVAGRVTVEAYPLPPRRQGQVRVFFSVADTGCGIPDDAIDKLFKPFSQVSQGYARGHQGAGLGLSICKRLVHLMDGNIAVESEVGVGTTMYFCITFGRVESAAGGSPAPMDDREGVRGELRVLVAEDDEMSLVTVRELLKKDGCAVTTATNGQEVLRILLEQDFDLILMDIQMPVMDGVEATGKIRSSPDFRRVASIPIIAMTAYAMEGDRDKFLSSGMDGYIAKPVSMRNLRAQIERVMERAKGA